MGGGCLRRINKMEIHTFENLKKLNELKRTQKCECVKLQLTKPSKKQKGDTNDHLSRPEVSS